MTLLAALLACTTRDGSSAAPKALDAPTLQEHLAFDQRVHETFYEPLEVHAWSLDVPAATAFLTEVLGEDLAPRLVVLGPDADEDGAQDVLGAADGTAQDPTAAVEVAPLAEATTVTIAVSTADGVSTGSYSLLASCEGPCPGVEQDPFALTLRWTDDVPAALRRAVEAAGTPGTIRAGIDHYRIVRTDGPALAEVVPSTVSRRLAYEVLMATFDTDQLPAAIEPLVREAAVKQADEQGFDLEGALDALDLGDEATTTHHSLTLPCIEGEAPTCWAETFSLWEPGSRDAWVIWRAFDPA